MNLAQLEAMVAVVDYGSFTAAADVLRISQPSLSRRIRALEDAIGADVFVASGRRMVLTDVGTSLLGPARRMLREASALEAIASSTQNLVSGGLRVAGLPSLVSTVVPAYVGRFHRTHPGIRLEIFGVEDTDELLEAVRLARADVAFGVIGRVPADLAVEPIGDQGFMAVLPGTGERTAASGTVDAGMGTIGTPAGPADTIGTPAGPAGTIGTPAGHADTIGTHAAPAGTVGAAAILADTVDAAMLASHTLVTLPRGTSVRAITDAVYSGLGVSALDIVTTTQRDALVPLALAGTGLTIVPSVLAEQAAAMGARIASFPETVSRPLGLIYRPDERRAPALTRFLELAFQVAAGSSDAPSTSSHGSSKAGPSAP